MLKLVLAEVGPGPTLALGPVPEVRIDGETMRDARSGAVLAKHQRHKWSAQGREFFRVDCACPVTLRFENRYGESSRPHGPFLHFSCADGIAYGDGEICANLDLESGRWYCHKDQKYWEAVVVKSAAAPAG